MTANVIISDENLFQNLRELIENPERFIGADIEIGYIPPLEVKLKGEQFDHSLTTTVMKGLVEFQEAINRSYCIARYNSPNLNYLEDYERDKLELVIVVNSGCTEIVADFKDIVQNIKEFCVDMTPNQKIAVISLFLAAFLAYSMVKSVESVLIEKSKGETSVALEAERTKQLLGSQENMLKAVELGGDIQKQEADVNQKTNEEPLDNTVSEENIVSKNIDASEQESSTSYFKVLSSPSSEDLALIEQVKVQYPQAADTFNTMSHGVERLIKSTSQADVVRYNNIVEMTGDMTQKITTKTRQKADKIVLKEKFRVVNVDSNKTQYMQAKLRPVDNSYPDFNATFTDSSIDKTKQKRLTDALISYHPIHLSIEAKSLNGKLNDALIAQVGKMDNTISFKENQDTTLDT